MAFGNIQRSMDKFAIISQFINCSDSQIIFIYKQYSAIGIGTSITERPSHTTGRTGHVSGDSAGLTGINKTLSLLGIGERNATRISATAA